MSETSPRAVRFSSGDDDVRPEKLKSPRSSTILAALDTSVEPHHDDPHALERQDELGSLPAFADSPQVGSVSSLAAVGANSGVNGGPRGNRSSSGDGQPVYLNGATPKPQRPHGPARTPSGTYNPPRRPQSGVSFVDPLRAPSKSRQRPSERFRAQEKAYVQKLRQDFGKEYFDQFQTGSSFADSDSEGETPSSEGPFDERYDQETIMFYGNDDIQPTEEDVADPANRERFEWHGMLAAVLTGDVVRQEKKRLIGAAGEQLGKTAQMAELWLGIRAKVCGRNLSVQRRMVEDARATLDRMLEEISNFKIKGESEVGKSPQEQVKEVVLKIEKCGSLYPSWSSLAEEHMTAESPYFQEAYEAILSWYNTTELINTELAILRAWVGNDDLDFLQTKSRSPSGPGLTDESSFIDRLLKLEDGLNSLYNEDDDEEKTTDRERGMFVGISAVILKSKKTLIANNDAFQKRHLPAYIEELLTLISFPSRLIEDIIKVRLAYAKKAKESAQQNPILLDQILYQFKLLLKMAIRIKVEYQGILQPEQGWYLPPCIDESFDQVVLDALKYYFKMLNWKLSGNKNTFKEAELLFEQWDFANDIGKHLQNGDVELAEQFSSLTFKAFNRLSQTFEKELQVKPKESAVEMSKRYRACLDSVRVRQRMLQRFSRMLSDNYENCSDFSIAYPPEQLREFFDRLVASGHFQVLAEGLEQTGVLLLASSTFHNRLDDIESILGVPSQTEFTDEPMEPYILLLRPEELPGWFGAAVSWTLREQSVDLKKGQARLIAPGAGARLANARKAFLEAVDMHVDLVVESRSNLHKVNSRLMDIRKVAYKLSNTFMDSVETIREQTKGQGCEELIQTCFVSATEFGQRSLLYMDSNRRQMNNLKLTKLALDWISFICDDCIASDRKTFRWAVLALEFAMLMTRGRHILALGEDEYDRLQAKVSGCMSLLISHFDIMGARSNLAARAEKERVEALVGQFRRHGKNRMLEDDEASRLVSEQRLEELARVEDLRRAKDAERQPFGQVVEGNTEVERAVTFLSSSASSVTMRWQQGHFVGGGTFGNVYAAMNLDTGHLMAVKEIRLQDPKLIPKITTDIKDEMAVLEVLDHPNVVSYYGIEVHRDRVYIFMEFCSGGSLGNLLEHGPIEDEQVVMVYALQLLEGLAYLHESGIAHRDIKPENILLDHNGIIKFVDFGAAKVIEKMGRTVANRKASLSRGEIQVQGTGDDANGDVIEVTSNASSSTRQGSMTGTPMYMSPEVIKGDNPGRAGAVDIWSLGCVICEMVTGRRPWGHLDNEWAIMYNIAQGNQPALPTPDQLSSAGVDFLRRCFLRDPKRRASAVELLQHEWIMRIRSQVVEPNTPSDNAAPSLAGTPTPTPPPTASGSSTRSLTLGEALP